MYVKVIQYFAVKKLFPVAITLFLYRFRMLGTPFHFLNRLMFDKIK